MIVNVERRDPRSCRCGCALGLASRDLLYRALAAPGLAMRSEYIEYGRRLDQDNGGGTGRLPLLPEVSMIRTATLLDAAGTTPHPDYPLDGVSLLPWLLDGAPAPARELLWRIRGQGSVRRGRHKLLVDRTAQPLLRWLPAGPGKRVRLFDVASGGREKADLSGEDPALTAELLDVWRRSILVLPGCAQPANTAGS
jgi:hypothetical protein